MKTKKIASIIIISSFVFSMIPIIAIMASNPLNSSNPLDVKTNFGWVEGIEKNSDTYAWLGIPYAAPPTGALRWKAPQDPQSWSGIKDTKTFGAPSVQIASVFGFDNRDYLDDIANFKILGSEDCLYLNIWKPKDASGSLPVYFFIYGGAYIYGQGGMEVYDGSNLANKANCIVVTFNYRLGTAGFFRSTALQTGNPLDDSGNFGILDIIKALEWTKENIASFGGDSDNIIIAGESAGGFSVYALLTSPYVMNNYFNKGIKLFHKAVIESGVIFPTDSVTAEGYANDLLVKVLIKNGLAKDEEQALSLINDSSDQVIEDWLRAESMESLIYLSQGQSLSLLSLVNVIAGVADGWVIASNPYISMSEGNFIKIPMIIGNNQEESKLFTAVAVDWTMQFEGNPTLSDLVEEITILLLNEIISLIINDYVVNITIPSMFDWILILDFNLLSDVLSEVVFTILGCELPAYLMNIYDKDIFVYEFCWNQEPAPFDVFLGAGHTTELQFVFGNMDENGVLGGMYTSKNEKGRIALSNAMISYWKNFFKYGNPGDPDRGFCFREGLPEWGRFQISLIGKVDKIIFDADNSIVNIHMD